MSVREYVITTDSTTDLPESFFAENGVGMMHVDYIVDDVLYDGTEKKLNHQEFYDFIRNGAMPVTQQINPQRGKEQLEYYVKQGKDVLHIAFTSGMSGTYNSMCMAQKELSEEYPDAKVVIIDSLCASLGEGLLVYYAVQLQKLGKTIDEVAQWVEDNKLRLFHNVVADDLFHLHRGGRVSKTAAIMGSALGIKPMIYVNDEGKLIPYSKSRGKKAALNQMAEKLAKDIVGHKNDIIFISHSDALADAEYLRDLIREKTGMKNFLIHYIGPTIGAHTGVGTVAVFYMAESRHIN